MPASQAGRRRFDSGRPLHWSSGVTAHAVAPDATANFSHTGTRARRVTAALCLLAYLLNGLSIAESSPPPGSPAGHGGGLCRGPRPGLGLPAGMAQGVSGGDLEHRGSGHLAEPTDLQRGSAREGGSRAVLPELGHPRLTGGPAAGGPRASMLTYPSVREAFPHVARL